MGVFIIKGSLKGVMKMVMCLKLFALGGAIYYFETRRPVTYLKESKKARRNINLLRVAIIAAAVLLLFATEIFFIDKMIF